MHLGMSRHLSISSNSSCEDTTYDTHAEPMLTNVLQRLPYSMYNMHVCLPLASEFP